MEEVFPLLYVNLSAEEIAIRNASRTCFSKPWIRQRPHFNQYNQYYNIRLYKVQTLLEIHPNCIRWSYITCFSVINYYPAANFVIGNDVLFGSFGTFFMWIKPVMKMKSILQKTFLNKNVKCY